MFILLLPKWQKWGVITPPGDSSDCWCWTPSRQCLTDSTCACALCGSGSRCSASSPVSSQFWFWCWFETTEDSITFTLTDRCGQRLKERSCLVTVASDKDCGDASAASDSPVDFLFFSRTENTWELWQCSQQESLSQTVCSTGPAQALCSLCCAVSSQVQQTVPARQAHTIEEMITGFWKRLIALFTCELIIYFYVNLK